MASRTFVFGLLVLFRWRVATAFWATLSRRTGSGGGDAGAATASSSSSAPGGFVTSTLTSSWTSSSSLCRMAPLSNEEIFARAQQTKQTTQQQDAATMMPPPPKIFDDDMLADMQAALLLLEKRVQEGPLTVLEVDQLAAQLHKIRLEMKQNQHMKPPRPAATTAAAAATATPPPPPAVIATSFATASTTRAAAPAVIDMDTPMDEDGPAYAGRGGLGQAADTANTYVIPGMEEMTADEYQTALEQTIIERQRQRRYSGGATGNRSSWNYLNSLTGQSGILKNKSGDDGSSE